MSGGGKAELVARVLRHVRAGQDSLETEGFNTASDSELQSSETTQMTQKTIRNQTVWKWSALSKIVMRYVCPRH